MSFIHSIRRIITIHILLVHSAVIQVYFLSDKIQCEFHRIKSKTFFNFLLLTILITFLWFWLVQVPSGYQVFLRCGELQMPYVGILLYLFSNRFKLRYLRICSICKITGFFLKYFLVGSMCRWSIASIESWKFKSGR